MAFPHLVRGQGSEEAGAVMAGPLAARLRVEFRDSGGGKECSGGGNV